MNNWSAAQGVIEETSNSANLAMQKYEERLNTAQAAIQQLKETITGIWVGSLDSNTITLLVKDLTTLLNVFGGLLKVIGIGDGYVARFAIQFLALNAILNKIGGLEMISFGVQYLAYNIKTFTTSSIAGIKGFVSNFVTGFGTAQASGQSFFSSIVAGGKLAGISLSTLTFGLALAIPVITTVISKVKEANAKKEEARQRNIEVAKSIEDEVKATSDLASEYTKISALANQTAEDKDRLREMQGRLVEMYGEEAKAIDLVNGRYDEEIQKIRDLRKEKLKESIDGAEVVRGDSQVNIDSLTSKQNSAWDAFSENIFNWELWMMTFSTSLDVTSYYAEKILTEHYDSLQEQVEKNTDALDDAVKQINKSKAELLLIEAEENVGIPKTIKDYKELISTLWDLGEEDRNIIELAGELAQQTYPELSDALIRLTRATDGDYMDSLSKALLEQEEFNLKLEESAALTKSAEDNISMLNDTLEKLSDGQGLTADSVIKLIEKYPELVTEIKKTEDGYILEKEALERLRELEMEKALETSREQVQITQAVVSAVAQKIGKYQEEINAIINLAGAQKVLNKLRLDQAKIDEEMRRMSQGGSSYSPYRIEQLMNEQDDVKELIEDMETLVDQYAEFELKNTLYYDLGTSSGGNNKKASSQQNVNKALQEYLDLLNHQKAIGKFDNKELEYIKKLEYALKNLAKTKKEKWDLEEKIYSARKAYEENLKKAAEERQRAAKEARDEEKRALDDARSALEALANIQINLIKQRKNAEKDALNALKDAEKEKLNAIQKVIDLRKEAIQQQKDERDFNKELAEKEKDVSDIKAQLLALEMDDSAWATRRKLELNEQLREKQSNLDEFLYKNSVDKQLDALDKEKEMAEDSYSVEEEKLNKKIELIDQYLSEQGTLFRDALTELNGMNDSIYKQMIDWNKKYGTGISSDITSKWKEATSALEAYGNKLNVLNTYNKVAAGTAKSATPSSSRTSSSSTSSSSKTTSTTTKSPSKPKKTIPSVGETVTVKKSASKFYKTKDSNKTVNMASFVKGGKYTAMQVYKEKDRVLIGKNGVWTGWLKKSDLQGYASGGVDSDGGLKMLHGKQTSVETIFNAKQGKTLFDLVNNPSMLSRSVSENIMKGINPQSYDRGGINITQGDIIIEGNADSSVIGEIRALKKEFSDYTINQINRATKIRGNKPNAKYSG